MNRRDLLGRVGVVVTIGGLARCLDAVETATDASSGDQAVPDGGEEPSPPFDADADEPYERYEVGDPSDVDEPYEVYIYNDADGGRTIDLEVVHDGEDLEETAVLPAGAYLEVLVESTPVDVLVETGGSRTRTAVDGPGTGGDRSYTVVTVRDGGIRTETKTESTSFDG